MRIIIISDIHANMLALESVMKKVKIHRPDMVICLGDLVGYGPHPNEVIEYMRSSNITCTLGGADERLAYDFARDKRPRVGVADKTLEWTRTVVEEANLAYLRDLPMQARINTPFGRLRFFHASMESTQQTAYFSKDPIPEKEFKRYRAKIVAHGKTHVPQIRKGPFGVVVNPGSVGLSLNGEPGADYAILNITADTVDVKMDKVEYDFAAVAFEIAGWELPAVVGEAVQQGRMPVEERGSQRDPSKVRIQTKVVVGRSGRNDAKTQSAPEKNNQETVAITPTPPATNSTIASSTAAIPSTPQPETDVGATASLGATTPSTMPSEIPPSPEAVLPATTTTEGLLDLGQVTQPTETTDDTVIPVANVPDTEDVVEDIAIDPIVPLASEEAASETASEDAKKEVVLSLGKPAAVSTLLPSGKQEHAQSEIDAVAQSDAALDDDGMLNLDAIEEAAQQENLVNPRDKDISSNEDTDTSLLEIKQELLANENGSAGDENARTDTAPAASLSPEGVAESRQEAQQIEASIDEKVDTFMLELQRQLQNGFEGTKSADGTKVSTSGFNFDALKALLMEQAQTSLSGAPKEGDEGHHG